MARTGHPDLPTKRDRPRALRLPAGSLLFHGTLEDIEGDLVGGGYDGVLWFADDPRIAQLYIPRAGIEMYTSSSLLARPSEDPHVQAVQALIGLHYDLSQVRWDRGRAQSYRVPEDWQDVGLNFDLNEEVERRLQALGYEGSGGRGFQTFKIHFADEKPLPPGGLQQGQLCVATTTADLRLWPKALGEGDLTALQYHDIAGFERARKAGYDGVMIDDFAQSEAYGNFGHLSVGLFPEGIESLEVACVDATYEEWVPDRTGTRAWPSPGNVSFDALLRAVAPNPAPRLERTALLSW